MEFSTYYWLRGSMQYRYLVEGHVHNTWLRHPGAATHVVDNN